jgi:hypothetical protein
MKTSLRLLLLAVFAVLFVGTASAHYNPQLGRWLSRDPMGEAGGFNLYAYCGNDPVNGHDPLGLQCWDPSYSPEMARRNAEGMRELWDNNGASQSMAEFAKEIQVINRRVAGGEMSVLEGIGRRVGLKGVQVVFGTMFSPFLYHDTGKALGTYNPKTIIIDEGILNGVVHKGSENVYDAWKRRDFASIMNAFDSGVDAFLIYKGGKASAELGFGRYRTPIEAPPIGNKLFSPEIVDAFLDGKIAEIPANERIFVIGERQGRIWSTVKKLAKTYGFRPRTATDFWPSNMKFELPLSIEAEAASIAFNCYLIERLHRSGFSFGDIGPMGIEITSK